MELLIDTATVGCSVALIDGDDVIAAIEEVVGRGHAERLVPMIGELPRQGRCDAIRVDCGPGSFTGVRVGLAAARALGLGWRVPVSGYDSLAVIAAAAFAAEPAAGRLAVAIAGGHGEIFVQQFAGRPLRALSPLASLSPAAAAKLIDDALVFGPGAALLVEARGHGEARAMLPRAADARLLPTALAFLPPRPIYGRAPDARLPA